MKIMSGDFVKVITDRFFITGIVEKIFNYGNYSIISYCYKDKSFIYMYSNYYEDFIKIIPKSKFKRKYYKLWKILNKEYRKNT